MSKTNLPVETEEDLVSSYTTSKFGSLHYVGPRARTGKEVVLFLHGFGSNWTIWLPLINAAHVNHLLTRQDVLLIDLPSFGASENRLNSLSSRDVGEELLRLTEKLGYTRVRIAGHSMGGFLAMDIAAHSAKISSVHLVAGTYLNLLRVVNDPLKGLLKSPRITLFYAFQQVVSRSELLASGINAAMSRLASGGSPLYSLGGKSFIYASRNGLGYDAYKEWGSITVPVYAVFGARDRLVTKADMEEMRAILPNAHLTMILGAGHSLLVSHATQAAIALFGEL